MGPLPDMKWLNWLYPLAGIGVASLFIAFCVVVALIVNWAAHHIQIV